MSTHDKIYDDEPAPQDYFNDSSETNKIKFAFELDRIFENKTSYQCERIILDYVEKTEPIAQATRFVSIKESPSERFFKEIHAVSKRMGKLHFHATNCLTPGCSRRAIGSHLISEKDLRLLETKDKKLYQLGHNGNFTKLELVGSGYSQTSKFMGFCNNHDRDLFSIFETQQYIGSYDQREASVYRSLAREFRAKVATIRGAVIECNQAAKSACRTNIVGYTSLAINLANVSAFNLEAIRFIVSSMRKIEARMSGVSFSNIGTTSSLIYTIEGRPNFLSWGVSSPKYELLETKNPRIQTDFNGEMFYVSTHVIDNNSYKIALSWDEHDTGTETWILEQILPTADIARKRLAPLLLSCCEETFFTREWWETIPQETRNALLLTPVREIPGEISLDKFELCSLEIIDTDFKRAIRNQTD